ncbi:hypothetical protein M8J75_016036 [Diaphorina citri]|nr:hypothetical protein M8J75_016036 [Diaphorina citri]
MAAPILAKHATRNGGISRKCFGNIPAIWRVDFLGQNELLRYQPLNILRNLVPTVNTVDSFSSYMNPSGESPNMSLFEETFYDGRPDKIHLNEMGLFVLKHMLLTKDQEIRSTRDNYGDVAIGRVEVGRNQSHCIVRGEVTPEHKVNLSAYKVSITLNEVQDVIEEAKCCGCKGAASGCKHII